MRRIVVLIRPDGTYICVVTAAGIHNQTITLSADEAGDWSVVATAPTMAGGKFALETQLNPTVSFDLAELDYTYDADGNVASVTDDWGGTTTYTYDALSRLRQFSNRAAGPRPSASR